MYALFETFKVELRMYCSISRGFAAERKDIGVRKRQGKRRGLEVERSVDIKTYYQINYAIIPFTYASMLLDKGHLSIFA